MNEYSCFHGHKKCKIPPRNMGVWSKIKWHVFYGSRCMSIHISSLLRRLDWYRSLSCDIALSYDDICTALCVCSALDVLEECVCDNHLSRNLSVFLFIYSICHFKNCFFFAILWESIEILQANFACIDIDIVRAVGCRYLRCTT